MRIVFFGSPSFAVPFLNALMLHEGFSIVGVVTQPDRPAGRGRHLTPCPVAVAASAYEVPVLKLETLKTEEALHELAELHANLFVVVAYGNIIPESVLRLAPLGCLNIHPSLLPLYRGSTPMQAAILAGDSVSGITIMLMDAKMDHGPVLSQLEIPMATDIDTPAFEQHVVYAGPELLIRTIEAYAKGTIKPREQEHEKATYVKLLDRESGHIDWNTPAAAIERMVRAYRPWPGTWTTWNDTRIKILDASVRGGKFLKRIGSVFPTPDGCAVQCKTGALELRTVQLDASRPMYVHDFLLGHKNFIGSILDSPIV